MNVGWLVAPGGLLAALLLAAAPQPPPASQLSMTADAGPEQVADPNPYFLDMALIARLECDNGHDGSGAWIAADRVLTVAHVADENCKIGGKPTEIVAFDGHADLAVLKTDVLSATEMEIRCEPPRPGETLFAIGYAWGRKQPVIQQLYATRSRQGAGHVAFKGEVYPAMSGGPIVDARGRIAAVVNTNRVNGTSVAGGLPLSNTSLCGAAR